MTTRTRPFPAITTIVLLLATGAHAASAQRVTTPEQALGFAIGDDYHLANYTQLSAYWQTLARESARMVLDTIGMTAEGRPQLMAILTSPENHSRLARYQEIARRLALAEGVSDDEARRLASEGKAVVWIDGGLHATEVLGAHQLMETVYQLVSRNDAETRRILDDVVTLAVHANPDGMELVSDWYMREADPTKRSTSGVPRLYQKYIGHDNNRDFYMVAQPETENMARVMYREWFPQIVYNHHQTGPDGAVLFAPPFRDPFNYNIDPLIPLGIEMVGAAMHSRFVAEGKPGATMRSGASYSTWWNGGLRTTGYFHNMIGLLTETIGNPTPMEIPFIPGMQVPRNDLPSPIEPQPWHFRQSIDYSITANRAVLDYASRYRSTLLYNIYLMGRNAIERGSRDHWTARPHQIAALEDSLRAEGAETRVGRRSRGAATEHFQRLRAPADRDPRGYILSAAQPDFPTATKFVNALIKNGVTVHQATAPFEVASRRYPAGSYVVKAAQAFRPHVIDMFEPQDHPDDFAYPGGPPIPPYDNAGWTLAFLMGVEFDRVLEGFDGPFAEIEGFATPKAGVVAAADGASGFLLSPAHNDAAVVVNRLLAQRGSVYRLSAPTRANGKTYPPGTIYLPAANGTAEAVRRLAIELGVSFDGVQAMPDAAALELKRVRIGLWDRYGGSMPSGWTRWLLEQFEFSSFEVVFPQRLDQGDLGRDFDVLIFPDGAIPASDRGDDEDGFRGRDPENVPPAYRSWLGSVTVDKTVPRLLEFLERGGTVITIGSSASLARHAGLPVVEHVADSSGRRVSRQDFYVPGSVLEIAVDTMRPVAWGMRGLADAFFDNSPVFRLTGEAAAIARVAWFASGSPLRSGWAWGEERLEGGIAAFEAPVGRGRLFVFGPEILNRGQPHGTFKLFFNALQLAGAEPVTLGRDATRP